MNTFGFIGCGNMGSAIAKAVAKSGAERILLSNRTVSKAKALAEDIGANVSSNIEIAKSCNFIVLGVKPQKLSDVLDEISPILSERDDRFVIITMIAGVTVEKLLKMAGGNYPVIRIMPNTAVEIGEGVTLYCKNQNVTDADIQEFLHAFSYCGLIDSIPENLIDAGSALSGCGPAFVYMFIEALADGGVLCGLPRDKALLYAAKTISGAGEMLLSTNKHPGELKDAVCSPGGMTIAGVQALEKSAFRSAAIDAVCAAFNKSKDLKPNK